MDKILPETKQTNLDDYQNLESITLKYPQITINQLRWIVANKERFQIEHAIKRIGKRLYLHIPSLLAWIESQHA